MYIEFVVTGDDARYRSSHLFKMLVAEIADWANVNKINYTSKLYKNTVRLAFDLDQYYTAFRLTWQDPPYIEHRIIDNKW